MSRTSGRLPSLYIPHGGGPCFFMDTPPGLPRDLWDRMAERRGKKKVFPAIVEQYLSAAHRDHAGQGCVIAAIGSEIARQPRSVRDSFTREFKHSLEYLAELMRENNSSRSTEDAIAAFVSMVGALIIARAVNDETLSDLILKSTAKRVVQRARVRRPARRRHSSMKA